MIKKILRLFTITLIALINSCSENNNYLYKVPEEVFNNKKDTILVDIYSIINGYYPNYRREGIEMIQHLYFDSYYYDSIKKINYFYEYEFINRYLRSNYIGYGGCFKLDDNKKYSDFRLVFETGILSKREVIEIGRNMFKEMITLGEVDSEYNKLNKSFYRTNDKDTAP